MNQVQIIHNPGAGDESHSGEQLKQQLEGRGYQCDYVSTNQRGWKKFDTRADILLIAGGDGTVRKVTKQLLGKKLMDKVTRISLLPLGTANNITRAIGIEKDMEDPFSYWRNDKAKPFDIGRVYNLTGATFFLESFGFGIFPTLMIVGEKQKKEAPKEPEAKLKNAMQMMYEITQSFEPVDCEFEIDGTAHAGKYLMLEITNTPSIGPNLNVSPASDPGDGTLEVVAVSAEQRDKFLEFLKAGIDGREVQYSYDLMTGSHIKIRWNGNLCHLDDELISIRNQKEVEIRLKRGLLDILVP
jgi:diacylglycerol kinase family enzyme